MNAQEWMDIKQELVAGGVTAERYTAIFDLVLTEGLNIERPDVAEVIDASSAFIAFVESPLFESRHAALILERFSEIWDEIDDPQPRDSGPLALAQSVVMAHPATDVNPAMRELLSFIKWDRSPYGLPDWEATWIGGIQNPNLEGQLIETIHYNREEMYELWDGETSTFLEMEPHTTVWIAQHPNTPVNVMERLLEAVKDDTALHWDQANRWAPGTTARGILDALRSREDLPEKLVSAVDLELEKLNASEVEDERGTA